MQQFLDYLTGLGRTRETQKKYSYAVEQWALFLQSHGWWPMQRAPRSAMRDFVTYLSVERHLSRSAVKQMISGVRKYLEWLEGRPEGVGVPEFLTAHAPSTGRRLPLVLSADQLSQYLTLALQAHQPYRTALLVAPFCGLRVTEFVGLRMGDLDARMGADGRPRLVMRVVGKGDKERQVPVFSAVNKALLAYRNGWRKDFQHSIDARTAPAQRWLWPAPGLAPYHHISRQSLEAWVAEMRPRLGLPKLRFHTLRATYLTGLLNTGVPMHEAARYAGHRDIQTLFDHYAGLHIDGAAAIFGDIAHLG